MRSLIASTNWLGVERIQIMMHTDCGALGLTRDVAEDRARTNGTRPQGFHVDRGRAGRGVELVRSEPLVDAPKGVTGTIYDVVTGELRTVVS